MIVILGYIAALIIGLSLGLIGGGGSILTVPVLVYLLGLSPVISTAYSLFIVGLTSLFGSYRFYKKGLVSLKTAIVFGIPSIMAVYTTRRYLVPAIPTHLFSVGGFEVTKGVMLMLLFAALMVFASISMIRQKKEVDGTVDDNIDTEIDVENESPNAPHPKPTTTRCSCVTCCTHRSRHDPTRRSSTATCTGTAIAISSNVSVAWGARSPPWA